MAGSVPPERCHHYHAHLPHRLVPPHFHHVRQGVQHNSVEHQWHRQHTYGTKHLLRGAQRQSGGHSESKLTAQSRSHNIQNHTLVRFQQQQPTISGTVRSFRPANCCQLIPPNSSSTLYSSNPQRPSDSTRSWLRNPQSGVCSQCHKSWGELFM